jgi:carbamoyl-phosphate synthase large subunit
MNALFVGGGRRVELAWRFIERGYTVYSYELDRRTPIASVARIVEGLQWNDENIHDDLQQVIEEHDIRLVIPLMDAAVPICSRLPFILGVTVLTPSPSTSDTCYDKKQFDEFMKKEFSYIYPAWDGERDTIAKPRFGFGSKHIITLKHQDDWQEFLSVHDKKNFIFQNKMYGDEYSVDAYFDRNAVFVDAVPRLRLRVGSGEVITSRTVRDEELQLNAKLIGERLGLVGPANMQFIRENGNGNIYNFEVNARFGGGWTFSIEAGLDAISLIDRDYFGIEFEYEPNKWNDNLLLERSYRDHYYEGNHRH